MLIRIYRDSCIEQDVIIKSDEKLVHFTEPVVYSIIRYIDNNIEDIRNIKDLAKKMGYNNCYISHLFRDKLNTSASEYLNKMKIERSKWLLHRYTVTEVADMMNFSSIQSFSRIFKMIEGVNPAEYIKQNNLKNKYSPN